MDFCFTQKSWEIHYFRIFVFPPNFSRIMGIHISHVLGIVWISASSEIFKKPMNLKCFCFSILFPYNGNALFPYIGITAWISASSKKFRKLLTLKSLRFPIFFTHYGNSLFPYFENCMDFCCFTQHVWETQHFGMFVFSHIFPLSLTMGIHFSYILGTVWISASSKIFKKPINLKCLCFPILFLYNGNPFFPCFGNCLDFWLKRKISETLNFWNVCVLSYFSLTMGIHFFHNLGIVRISDSPKKFKKPVNVKCLYFPILFSYYGNPLFPCVGNCMDFCFKQKIPETLNFEMFVFSHIFSLLWEFTFLIFWELYVLMPHIKYVRNP